MKTWTIGRLITLGFSGVIITTALVGLLAFWRLATIQQRGNQIAKETLPAAELVNRVGYRGKQLVADVYRHVASREAQDQARLEAAIQANRAANGKDLETLEALMPAGKVHELHQQLLPLRTKYGQVLDQVLAMSRSRTNEAGAVAIARNELDPASEAYITKLEAMTAACNESANQGAGSILSQVKSSQTGIVGGLVVAVVAGVLVAWWIIRSTDQRLGQMATTLREGAEQVASAARQLSSGSQSLAQGTSEQAASLEETSSSLEAMSSMTQQTHQGAQKAVELAKEARQAAENSTQDMQAMSAAMEAIKTSSNEIAKIIKTIDEIAFQTNILALNAAVEAARAGEAGMGFAVVADEVRNLAQRSAQEAKETAHKIETAVSNTEQGVQLSAEVAKGLQEIVDKIHRVDDIATQAAAATHEQSQGITQLNLAVSQMDKVTQDSAANAEESASAAEELNAQAEALMGAVTELLQMVGRASAAQRLGTPASRTARAPQRKTAASPAPSAAARPGGGQPATFRRNGDLVLPAVARSNRPSDGRLDEFKDL